jgi:peroxidase
MREHNYWVHTFKAQNPTWSGAQLYSMARAVTIGEYQNIVYSAYLPHLIGPALRPYAGYSPNTNPQVTQEFSTAAFRVGHSQVSDTQEGLASNGSVLFTESLATAFFNTPALDESNGIDPILRSLGVDFSQATDVYTVSALRNLLFAGLVGGEVDKIDLIAIDIQRERDVELGSLNQTRQALHLRPYASFAQLTSDPVLQASFQNVYGTIDNVDLFMGGLAEAHAPGANVGPTFQAIIADQFQRLRSGDRFYWQNEGFDRQTQQMISQTTLATLLDRDTVGTNASGDLFVAAAIPGHRKRHVKLPLPGQQQ